MSDAVFCSVTDGPILDVQGLNVKYRSNRGSVDALRDVSFSLGCEKVAVVGESGSGKSTLGRTIMGILPESAQVSGRILFDGDDLLSIPESRMRDIRGGDISMILQDPKFSLNPVMRVGEQIAETFLAHQRCQRKLAVEKALESLEAVKIRDPKRVYNLYPHEISGGMGQRVMIAMMLVAGPKLVVADEPTSALDVTVRMEVLSILEELVATQGAGLLFISHDLNLVSKFCDRLIIMYAGRIVETISSKEIQNSTHPYTQGLWESLPRLNQPCDRLAELSRCDSWLDPGSAR